jgi:hypothetical protein
MVRDRASVRCAEGRAGSNQIEAGSFTESRVFWGLINLETLVVYAFYALIYAFYAFCTSKHVNGFHAIIAVHVPVLCV